MKRDRGRRARPEHEGAGRVWPVRFETRPTQRAVAMATALRSAEGSEPPLKCGETTIGSPRSGACPEQYLSRTPALKYGGVWLKSAESSACKLPTACPERSRMPPLKCAEPALKSPKGLP